MSRENGNVPLALGGAAVAVALVAIWLMLSGGESRAELEPAARPDATPAAERVATPQRPATGAPPVRDSRVEAEEPTPTPAATPEPERDAIDRRAEATLRVKVTDRFGAPVSQAIVRGTGLRLTVDPGSWYGWGEGVHEETGTDGIAEFLYPVWSKGFGGDWSDIERICFTVEHPGYVTRDVEGAADEDEISVVLELGSVLVVSGWIDEASERVLDVDVQLNHQVDVKAEDWAPLRDGRLSCNKIPAGEHILALRHERDGVHYQSVGTDFEMQEAGQVELHLQLLAPRTVHGELDAEVPRPVEDGIVHVAVQSGSRDRGAVLMHVFTADVEPDGTFVVRDVPPGQAQVIGYCTGWSSISAPPPEGTYTPVHQALPEENAGETSVDFVLRMQATSRLRVTVLDPSGAPLEGAVVNASPNVQWKVGFSQIFAETDDLITMLRDRRWYVGTDENGVALLENLPPGANETVYLQHARFLLPEAQHPSMDVSGRNRWVDLAPGETHELTVQLENGED